MNAPRRRETTGRWPLLLASMAVIVIGLLFLRVRGDLKIWGDLFHVWSLILGLGVSLLAGYLAWDWETVVRAVKSGGTLRTAGALVQILMVLAIIVSVNYFASRNYKKWDLTEERINMLAPQSEEVARSLGQDVTILGFFKSGQPARDTFKELAGLYAEASPRITVRLIDPDADPVTTRDYNVGMAGTVILESGEKRQSLPAADEQELTRGLIRITRQVEKTVCFTTGHGERGLDDPEGEGLTTIRSELAGQGLKVIGVNILSEGGVRPECSLLVIAGPTRALSPDEIPLIRDFVDGRGGALMVLVDPQTPDQSGLLKYFNVRPRNDVVVDANPLNQMTGQNFLAPVAAAYGRHEIIDKMKNVQTIFPLARSLERIEGVEATDPAATSTSIVFTSEDSWGETDLAKGTRPRPDQGKDALGPVVLMEAGIRLVKRPGTDGGGDDGDEAGEDSGEGKTRSVRFVVAGDSDFITNQWVSYYGNKDLFLNAVSWVTGDTELISIRPRKRGEKPINLPSESFTRFISWVPSLLFPLLLVLMGVFIQLRRRRL